MNLIHNTKLPHSLLPHLDNPIPTAGKYCRRFHWMSRRRNDWTLIVRVILLQYPRPLKIPKNELAVTVSRANKPSIGTDDDITRVPCNIVALGLFLLLKAILFSRLVDDDAIIETLAQ